MFDINIEVKLLQREKPFMFTWWNKADHQIEALLISCPCQGFSLLTPDKSGKPGTAHGDEDCARQLAKAVEKAEICSFLEGKQADGLQKLPEPKKQKSRRVSYKTRKKGKQVDENSKTKENTPSSDKVSRSEASKNSQGVEIKSELEVVRETAKTSISNNSFSAHDAEQSHHSDDERNGHEGYDPLETTAASVEKVGQSKDIVATALNMVSDSQSTDTESLSLSKSLASSDVYPQNTAAIPEEMTLRSKVSNSDTLGSSSDAHIHIEKTADFSDRRDIEETSSDLPKRSTLSPISEELQKGSENAVSPRSKRDEPIPAISEVSSEPPSNMLNNGTEGQLSADEQMLFDTLQGLMKPIPSPLTVESKSVPSQIAECNVVPKSYISKTKPSAKSVKKTEYRKALENEEMLLAYRRKMNSRSTTVLCEICGKPFARKTLRRHMASKHPTEERKKKHQCVTCGKTFLFNYSLKRHQLIHEGVTYSCKFCKKEYRQDYNRNAHERICTSNPESSKSHTCPICNKVFPFKNAADRHIRTHEERKYCKTCWKPYKYSHTCPIDYQKEGLSPSIENDLSDSVDDKREGNWNCGICGKEMLYRSSYLRHMTTHTNDVLKCRYCEKTYKQSYNLKAHERTHEGGKPRNAGLIWRQYGGIANLNTKCNICGKIMKGSSIRKHLAAHKAGTITADHNRKKCELCGVEVLRTSLNKHMETHADDRFPCPVCGKLIKYSCRYGHSETHKEKRYTCEYCAKLFVNKNRLKIHMRIHTKEKPLKCRYCDERFARAQGRINHERRHTGEKPFRCDICNKDWRDRSTYWGHMKKHHPGVPLQYRSKTYQLRAKIEAQKAKTAESQSQQQDQLPQKQQPSQEVVQGHEQVDQPQEQVFTVSQDTAQPVQTISQVNEWQVSAGQVEAIIAAMKTIHE